MQAGQITASGGQEYPLVSAGLFYPDKLPGQQIQSFIPRDAFKQAFTLFARPFLGKHEAFRMVDHLAVGPAAETGPELFRLRSLVAFDADNPIVPDVQSQRASASAIEGGSGSDNPDLAAILV
jgi:hypothetical protein